MTRKRIEVEQGAILPLTRGLWHAASEKLDEAEQAIDTMRSAVDRIAYEAGWSQFVDSIEEFWTRFFDEGKTSFSSFPPWAGAIDRERKDDEALCYIYQARHQSQHGRIPLAWEAPKLIIGQGFAGRMYGLRIFPDQTYEADAVPDNPAGQPFQVKHSPGKALLPTIENKRYNQLFPPPSTHLGRPLTDSSPIAVSRIVLDYYRGVLGKAFKAFNA